MSEPADTAVHLYPVWRDRADFIIHGALKGLEHRHWEQLWARQVTDDQFEICCIPFFVYDLGLGDIVQTHPLAEKLYVVDRVLIDAGRCVFRIWFGDIEGQGARHEVMDEVENKLVEMSCEREWYAHDLLGIAITTDRAELVTNFLSEKEQRNGISFEIGRSC
jgi:Domain of unknown function (DUF4265)